jgi:hypothetical protein
MDWSWLLYAVGAVVAVYAAAAVIALFWPDSRPDSVPMGSHYVPRSERRPEPRPKRWRITIERN